MNTTYTINHNSQFNSLEVSFNGKPSEAIREALKSLRFRWHGVKKVWYGFADEMKVKEAIDKAAFGVVLSLVPDQQKAEKEEAKGTEQNHIKIYYNGIKIDGGNLIKCCYSIGNNAPGTPETIGIYAHGYGSQLPRDLLPVKNDTDLYTDYFDNDSAHITAEHPLYKYFYYAGLKAEAKNAERHIKQLEKQIADPRYHSKDYYRQEIERAKKHITAFENAVDPGQPTAEDLAQIDSIRQEAENRRKAEEHEEELKEREFFLNLRCNGRNLIEETKKAYPVKENEPSVLIRWSEHPAFYEYGEDSLILSVAAAEIILSKLDAEYHAANRGYMKTSFVITGTAWDGEPLNYDGRYDLGDNDGGLIKHIRSFGEWYLTHDEYGHEKETPDKTNDNIVLADWLKTFTA